MNWLKKIYSYRELIWILAIKNLKSRYAGTAGGIFWAIFQPLLTVLVYWFIFSIGFRIKPQGDIPFIIVFLSAFIPWMMFSEMLTANVSSLTNNSHLVKKTTFPLEFMPIINWLSSSLIHIILLFILCIIMMGSGLHLKPITPFLLIFYFAALSLLSIGLGWIFSALNVFYRDFAQIIGSLLQIWFWMTPIAWFTDMIPQKWHFLIQLNPIFYVTEGYRSSLSYGTLLSLQFTTQVYFWILCIGLFLLGAHLFRRLKRGFADSL